MTEYNFSNKAKAMKSSKIRELMKYATMPGVISFGGGSPDPVNFPFKEVRDIINNWGETKYMPAMQYGATTGYPSLIYSLKERMEKNKKIDMTGQDLLVTTGGQQALYLLGKIFLNKGDIVLVEEPSFIGGIAAFLSNEAKLQGVALENDGINLKELEDKLSGPDSHRIKFLYTIPNFQNPGGVTMSLEKRKRLYEISIRYDLTIIEDDPYGDLFFEGNSENYLPLKSLGNEAKIIYLSSFSKILCPGFRLGWLVGDKEVVDKCALAKQSIDACSSTFGQVVAYDYLKTGAIDSYLENMRGIYRDKRDLMLLEMNSTFPKEVKWTNPKGGFFIYITLPDGISAEAVFKKAIENKVAFVTGEPFHTNPVEGDKHMRIAYSTASIDQIKNGIKIIGNVLKDML